MIFYRLLRIQAFIIGAILFGALLAFGWLVEHGSAILRFAGLLALGLVAILVIGVIASVLDLQAQKRRDPAAYEEKMRATRQRLEAVREIRRAAAAHRARTGVKRRPVSRRRHRG